ncbi:MULTISPECIES: hypothetical protein [unclassified Candidatus Paralachnospira]|uniref:hypothetical protein n=1 Tax=unclassified Candidatus Paralachnospira TaxID=3099471 RepID=UPI003F906E08
MSFQDELRAVVPETAKAKSREEMKQEVLEDARADFNTLKEGFKKNISIGIFRKGEVGKRRACAICSGAKFCGKKYFKFVWQREKVRQGILSMSEEMYVTDCTSDNYEKYRIYRDELERLAKEENVKIEFKCEARDDLIPKWTDQWLLLVERPDLPKQTEYGSYPWSRPWVKNYNRGSVSVPGRVGITKSIGKFEVYLSGTVEF